MSQRPITGEPVASLEPISADGRLVTEAEYWQDWYNTADLSYECLCHPILTLLVLRHRHPGG
ncbi:hypothetical protein [Halochromatium roseum]|uniref:hypothetical protein n=1 Tax=Halochromatium roseum TaxID=391920 RepID=UPI001911A24B|nr:hypothetical protein [Halochromatium roseum]MBK5940287.1 hypothetical protein [Halochromatium roseum]